MLDWIGKFGFISYFNFDERINFDHGDNSRALGAIFMQMDPSRLPGCDDDFGDPEMKTSHLFVNTCPVQLCVEGKKKKTILVTTVVDFAVTAHPRRER